MATEGVQPDLRAPAAATQKGFLERNKTPIAFVLMSGISVTLAGHAVNMRNRADEIEAELLEQLRASVDARNGLVLRAPELAREMGLPARAEGTFREALQKLDSQLESEAASVYGEKRAVAAGTVSVSTPAAAPASAAAPKQQAVW